MKPQRQKRNILTPGKTIPKSAEPTIKIVIEELNTPDNQQEISILDINDSGMGITCMAPLKVGQHLLFNNLEEDWELPEKGVVMWTFKENYKFRAGIKFV